MRLNFGRQKIRTQAKIFYRAVVAQTQTIKYERASVLSEAECCADAAGPLLIYRCVCARVFIYSQNGEDFSCGRAMHV